MAMKRIWIILVIAFGLPIIAAADDLSGTWTVKGEFGSSLKYTLLCVWKADSDALAGPCIAMQGAILKTTGRASGNTMRFRYLTDYNGSGLHLEYNGLIQPDGILKGTVNTGLSSGVFQAVPLAASAADHSTTWKLSVSINDGLQYVALCTFKADGEKLHGPCALTQGPTLQATGTSDGSHVAIGYDTEFQGRPIHVVYTGAVQSDGSLQGTISAGDSVGVFSAAKQ